MSTVTGAPASLARALGFQDLMKGTADESRADRADHGRGGGQEAAAAMVDRSSVFDRIKHLFIGHPALRKSFGR